MKTSEFLKQAKSLIDSPEKWTTEFVARNAQGGCVAETSDEAICFCSVGALYKQAHISGLPYIPQDSWKYLRSGTNGVEAPKYNDSHTHAEVMLAWDKAIALAENEGD